MSRHNEKQRKESGEYDEEPDGKPCEPGEEPKTKSVVGTIIELLLLLIYVRGCVTVPYTDERFTEEDLKPLVEICDEDLWKKMIYQILCGIDPSHFDQELAMFIASNFPNLWDKKYMLSFHMHEEVCKAFFFSQLASTETRSQILDEVSPEVCERILQECRTREKGIWLIPAGNLSAVDKAALLTEVYALSLEIEGSCYPYGAKKAFASSFLAYFMLVGVTHDNIEICMELLASIPLHKHFSQEVLGLFSKDPTTDIDIEMYQILYNQYPALFYAIRNKCKHNDGKRTAFELFEKNLPDAKPVKSL